VHSCKGPELRIEGTISDGAKRFSFRRRKGTIGTLLNPDETQIQESALAPFLRELDRERFEQFFGLDYERLRAGGEELLRGKGGRRA
jgi:AAA domain